jgi:hypothetical protein
VVDNQKAACPDQEREPPHLSDQEAAQGSVTELFLLEVDNVNQTGRPAIQFGNMSAAMAERIGISSKKPVYQFQVFLFIAVENEVKQVRAGGEYEIGGQGSILGHGWTNRYGITHGVNPRAALWTSILR